MKRKRVALAAGVAALAAMVVGATLAIAGQRDAPAGIASGAPPASGVTPNGVAYEISTVESDYDGTCIRIAAGGLSGEGCLPPITGGMSRVGVTILGSDLFVVAVGREGVKRLKVLRLDGRGAATSEHSAEESGLHLLHAVLSTPQETLPRTDAGLPVAPSVKVQGIDASGVTQEDEVIPAAVEGKGPTLRPGEVAHDR